MNWVNITFEHNQYGEKEVVHVSQPYPTENYALNKRAEPAPNHSVETHRINRDG